jgi:hypothetical protein
MIQVCKNPDDLGVNYRRGVSLPPGATFKDVGLDLEWATEMGEPQNVVLLTIKGIVLGPGEKVCVRVQAMTDKESNPTDLSPKGLRRYELVGVTDSSGELRPFMPVDSNLPNLFARVVTPFK